MIWFLLIIASLFTFYVGLVYPLLSYRRYQIFLREIVLDPTARSHYYRRNMLNKWPWLIVIGIILLFGFGQPSMLGLRAPYPWGPTLWLLAELVIVLPIAHVLQLRIIAKRPRTKLLSLVLAVREMLPHTASERLLWILVSFTAGICEEIVYRGFLPLYFLQLGSFFGLQVSYLVVVILSTLLFGLAHLYQGWKGVLATSIIGAMFAYLYFYTGSLILPIAFHILIDARIVLLAPALLKRSRTNRNEAVTLRACWH
jgi:membrane protease YdiL (CAAX protease family)